MSAPRRYGLAEIDWEYLGAIVGQADSVQQTAFFKSMVREMKSWGTEYQRQTQLAYVELTDEERDTLAMLGPEVTPRQPP